MTRNLTANASQRARRQSRPRMDYHPAPQALAVIKANVGASHPDNTLSGVLDRIVHEWALDRGRLPLINNQRETTLAGSGELGDFRHHNARAYDFGPDDAKPNNGATIRCGARRHRDGQPCQARSEPGKRRCRFHGGKSTGPRTEEGRARALANLRRAPVESMALGLNQSARPDPPRRRRRLE